MATVYNEQTHKDVIPTHIMPITANRAQYIYFDLINDTILHSSKADLHNEDLSNSIPIMPGHGSAAPQERRRLSTAPPNGSGAMNGFGFDDFDSSEWVQSLVPVQESNEGFDDGNLASFAYPSHVDPIVHQPLEEQSQWGTNSNRLNLIPSSVSPNAINPSPLYSGIRQDAFLGLDDSTRRASMQLLNGGNFAIPHDNDQALQPSYSTYEPIMQSMPYYYPGAYNAPLFDHTYATPHAPAMHEPMLGEPTDHYSYQQPHTDHAARSLANQRKRQRAPSYDDDDDDGNYQKRRRARSSSSGQHSGGGSSLPSYTSSRRSTTGSSRSTRTKSRKTREDEAKEISSRASTFVEFKPEMPKTDQTKPWIRTNNTTKGLTSRTGKINNYCPKYEVTAHPIGTWTGKKTTFEYTEHGEIKAPTLTASQIYDFIAHYPMNKEKKQRLVLWIQKAPTDSARRFPTHTWSTCRFADCPNRNGEWTDKPQGSIIHGHYRVAFDEKWIKYGSKTDPNLPSFYVHLYCMEKFLDLPYLVHKTDNFDVRIDRRSISAEPGRRWAPSLNDQPEVLIAEDFITACKENSLRSMSEFKHYPYHDSRKRGEDQKKSFRKTTLTYWMNHYKRNNRPPAQFSQFANRGFKPSNILVNNGDLEIAFWDIKHTISQNLTTKKAKKEARMARKKVDDGSMFPRIYANDPELVAIYNDLMPLYHSKIGSRKQRTPRRKTKMASQNRRGSEDCDQGSDPENHDEVSDEEPDVQYDPQAQENDSDADDDVRPLISGRPSQGTQGSRRSVRVQRFQAEGRLPQTYAELDNTYAQENGQAAEPGFNWIGELAAIQQQPQYQNYHPVSSDYTPAAANVETAAPGDPTFENYFDPNFDSDIDNSFLAEFEAEAAKLEKEKGETLDEQTLKDLGLDLYRRHSTVDLPVGQVERLASFAKLLSPIESRKKSSAFKKRSVSFLSSESEIRTFRREEPPTEVSRSLRSRDSLANNAILHSPRGAGVKKNKGKSVKFVARNH